MSQGAGEHYIGLMSGTSADGVDAVVATFEETAEGLPLLRLEATYHLPMPRGLRAQIEAAMTGPCPLYECATLDVALGRLFADAALAALARSGLPPEAIQAIGSHGQTIRHAPRQEPPYTVQIGDPAVIAERTGITTVGHFRTRDVAAGGQGAPLVPAFHQWLFASPAASRAVLNLGGIANVTLLAADGSVQGFDTGPANTLLDRWIGQCRGLPFDAGGAWAASGQVARGLLVRLQADPYFQEAPPKSTGREYFNLAWLQSHLGPLVVRPEDVQATLAELTAWSVVEALRRFGHTPVHNAYVCGGGRRNEDLMRRLRQEAPDIEWQGTEVLGLDPEWVEASAFAWLASRTLHRQTGSLPAVTGARHACVLGAVYWGQPR